MDISNNVSNQDASQFAGLGATVKALVAMAPQVSDLLHALSNGAVQGQQHEAQRLARKHGESDARAQAAQARSQAWSALADAVNVGVTHGSHLVQTAAQDNLFHGYVLNADGSPAKGHTVELTLPQWKDGKGGTFRGKTAADGYFRLWLGATADPGADGGSAAGVNAHAMFAALASRMARQLRASETLVRDTQPGNAAKAAPVTSPAPAPSAAPSPTSVSGGASGNQLDSRVRIFNAAGQQVDEDRAPPVFDVENGALHSQFRYYALPG